MCYYCNDCNNMFEESEADSRPTRLEDSRPKGGFVMLCPYCGSDDLEEASYCERCGEPIPPDEHLCDVCEGDLYGIVQGAIESYKGDVFDAKSKFFDYLERKWF